MKEVKKLFKELLPYIIVVVLVILVKAFIIMPVQVSGNSMYPTLHNKDIMLLEKVSVKFSDIKRGDIIVARHEKTKIIKRVIGLPGDNLYVKDNTLYINDKKYEEDYLMDGLITDDFTLLGTANVVKIPKGKYFVMGDNREDSLDSRIFGLVDQNNIEGKAFFTIYPFNRFGTKE